MKLLESLLRSRLVAYLLYYPLAFWGIAWFRARGSTPWAAYSSMRRLYCLTLGRSNSVLSPWVEKPPGPREAHQSTPAAVLPLTERELDAAVEALGRDGFHLFGPRLEVGLCDALTRLALRTPGRLLPRPPGGPEEALFDPLAAPLTVKYDLPEQALCDDPQVQRLLTDPSLLALARAYLGSVPCNDLVAMWWSTAAAAAPSSEVAQLFHFDLDRLRFLKIFFYLTDVTPRTGPHVYVQGSHRHKPPHLFRDGRHTDEAIAQAYGPERIKELCAPRGSILAVDTSGFHKGKRLEEGHRLILQLELTNSLFGQRYSRIQVAPGSALAAAKRRLPDTFVRYDVRTDG